jgi:hypothetical protein
MQRDKTPLETEARYEVYELGGQSGCYIDYKEVSLPFMPEKRASPRLTIGHVDPAVSPSPILHRIYS